MEMKKLRLREWVKTTLGIALFYGIIVFGVIGLNERCEQNEDYNQYYLIEK